jgi:hypothetical protein
MLRGIPAAIRASIQALTTRGYRPLPSAPPDAGAPGASALPTPGDEGAARDLAGLLTHWTGIIEQRLETDPVLARVDIAECLGVALRGLRLFHDSPDPRLDEAIGRLLGSPRLLQAVIATGSSVAVEYRKLAEDVQVAYLVALGIVVSSSCLSSDCVLGLLLGRAGKAGANPAIRSYVHHLHSLESVAERCASIFAEMVNLTILKSYRGNDESEDQQRREVCGQLLVQKGYGPGGGSNLYSAIALGEPSPACQRLLRALAEYDLLPAAADLALKKGRRGRDLEHALAAASALPHRQHHSTPEECIDWMLGSIEVLLCPDRLEALRAEHRERIERSMAEASAQARQLESALLATGLR